MRDEKEIDELPIWSRVFSWRSFLVSQFLDGTEVIQSLLGEFTGILVFQIDVDHDTDIRRFIHFFILKRDVLQEIVIQFFADQFQQVQFYFFSWKDTVNVGSGGIDHFSKFTRR